MFALMLHMFVTSAVLVTGFMILLWIIAVIRQNAGIVDVGWGIAFFLVALVAAFMGIGSASRKEILLLLIGLWSLRLSWHLLIRFLSTEEDKRYHRMRMRWKTQPDLKFLALFLFQGVLVLTISLPFYIIANANGPWSNLETIGVALFLVALIGETLSDRQLKNYKLEKGAKGRICQKGFWAYSRHPNYFFELLIWVGIAFLTFPHPYGEISLVSVILMFILLRFISGVPLAEKELLESRGEAYRQYQHQVNCFIPWFRKPPLL